MDLAPGSLHDVLEKAPVRLPAFQQLVQAGEEQIDQRRDQGVGSHADQICDGQRDIVGQGEGQSPPQLGDRQQTEGEGYQECA